MGNPFAGCWSGPGVDYSWLNNLFAPLPPPPVKPQEPKQPWPAEARAIARSLLRTEHLTGVKDGLRIEIQTESFDARWDALTGRSQTRAIVSPQRLVDRFHGDGSQTYLSWADAKERGSLAAAMLLGRVRASQAGRPSAAAAGSWRRHACRRSTWPTPAIRSN